MESGDIVIHKAVLKEVTQGEDDLSKWIGKIKIHTTLKLQDTMPQYGIVMNHIQECGYYNDQGVKAWSDLSIADPQLIASALKERDLTIVTIEQPTGKGNTRKRTNPKIPDVAKDFGVETMDLFRMMRELGFRL